MSETRDEKRAPSDERELHVISRRKALTILGVVPVAAAVGQPIASPVGAQAPATPAAQAPAPPRF